jgi:hypothetical protein
MGEVSKMLLCGERTYFIKRYYSINTKREQKTHKQREAEVAAAALIHELEQGIYIEESCQTFCDFANEWLPIYSESKDVKLGTI